MKRKNNKNKILKEIRGALRGLKTLSVDSRIEVINKIKIILSERYSPFKNEPVDCIIWEKLDNIVSNDYNPNSVAPPEMELLKTSILHDGYTQPVVTWPKSDGIKEVVDGFHRNRVARESPEVLKRVKGYLPVVTIRSEQTNKNDRVASTIRHNRARGKHKVDSMSDIVIELKRRNWSNNRISKELGMEQDEILRLCQMSGLQEMFSDEGFSNSWDIDIMSEEDIELILDEDNIEPDKDKKENRILHTYDKWECHKAGFYESKPPGDLTREDCEEMYKNLLSDTDRFSDVLESVTTEWKNSCEHYLTNDTMNRIAWLGQAALCYEHGVPSTFRGGYNLLTNEQKIAADETALSYLNEWLESNGFDVLEADEILKKPKADIY